MGMFSEAGWIAQGWALAPWAAGGAWAAWRWRRGDAPFHALERAALIWCAWAWAGAQALGIFGALSANGLRALWLAGLAAAGWLLWRERTGGLRRRPIFQKLPPCGWLALWAVPIVLAGLRAGLAPPVTVDVLNYHGPRQLFWLEQGSLASFATANDRLNMMPPLAEVIGLQFLGITGDDRWANLPQFFGWLWLAAGCHRLARRLGARADAARLAATAALFLPMAYHEASNGKNDLVLAALVVATANQALARGRSWLWPGLAAGLALLAKSTALLCLPPLLAWLAAREISRSGAARAALRAGLIAVTAGTLFTPFALRNLAWYGSVLGEHRAADGGEQQSTLRTPPAILSTAIRNATQHMATGWPAGNAAIARWTEASHRGLGMDCNDRRTTLWTMEFSIAYNPRSETLAGAPAHFALLLLGLAWAVLRPGRGTGPAWVTLAIAFAYCAALKWQPWAPRLQVAGFALGGVALALVVSRAPGRTRRALAGAASTLILLAWWPARETAARPLWTEPSLFARSREADLHRYFPELEARDTAFADVLLAASARDAVLLYRHGAAYPLMRRLKTAEPEFRFVTDRASAPAAVVLLDHEPDTPAERLWLDGTRYVRAATPGPGAVYLRESR